MNLRTTMTLLLVLGLAAGAAWFLRDGDEPAENVRQPLVPDELLADLEWIEFQLLSGEVMKLVRESGNHFVMEFGRRPGGDQLLYRDWIDPVRRDQLLQAITSMWREAMEGEADDDNLLRLGLSRPRYRLKARGAGREVEIRFGADDPSTEGVLMAHQVGQSSIFRTGRQLGNVLELNLENFRDRRVFTLDPRTLDEIDILVQSDTSGDPEAGLEAHRVRAVRDRMGRFRVEAESGSGDLRADESKVRGLAQRLTALQVISFKAQDFSNEDLSRLTGFPDHSCATISLRSGDVVQVLDVGLELNDDQVSARSLFRDPECTTTVDAHEIRRILATSTDDLRWKRLTPAIESSLVALRSSALPPGEARRVAWEIRRRGDHPRGEWEWHEPFAAPANELAGDRSWPQVVVELDRYEIEDFLDPDEEEFRATRVLDLYWKSGEIIVDLELSLLDDGERILGRASDRPGELFLLPRGLWDLAGLEPVEYRDPRIWPDDKTVENRIRRYRLSARGGLHAELVKERGRGAEPLPGTDSEWTTRLTSMVHGYLFGCTAERVLPASGVVDAGLEEPLFEVELEIEDGEPLRVRVGAPYDDQSFYAEVSPGFDGMITVLPRSRLEEFLAAIESP